MKTTITTFVMLMLATPVFATAYCRHPYYPGHGTAFITMFIPEHCRFTKAQLKEKAWCQLQQEGERGRICWGYGLQ